MGGREGTNAGGCYEAGLQHTLLRLVTTTVCCHTQDCTARRCVLCELCQLCDAHNT